MQLLTISRISVITPSSHKFCHTDLISTIYKIIIYHLINYQLIILVFQFQKIIFKKPVTENADNNCYDGNCKGTCEHGPLAGW
jgi:hypothetical protein